MSMVPTEAQEQIWLFKWAEIASMRWPELETMFHIPNGGKRGAIEAARFKAQGVRAGVPDIFLPAPRGRYHGLFIELKRQTGGRVSEAQREMIQALRMRGYCVEVCKGYHEAADLIEKYLQNRVE